MVSLIISHTIHNDANHHFFLFDARFSNHDCKSNQGIVGYSFVAMLVVEKSVPVQKIEEESCRDAFVTVTETVVLGASNSSLDSSYFCVHNQYCANMKNMTLDQFKRTYGKHSANYRY